MTESTAALAHLNLMDFCRLMAETSRGGASEEYAGALLTTFGHPLPFLNSVMNSDGVDPDQLLARAGSFFGGHGHGFVVLTREGDDADDPLATACEQAGMDVYPHYPEMVCSAPVTEPSPPAGTELRRVADAQTAGHYWDICASAYPSIGFPPDAFAQCTADLLLHPDVEAWVSYLESEPVASAMTFDSRDVAFIGWVATLERARGKGLGELCAARATNAGLGRGAKFASLQASPMGEAIYERAGYEHLYNYRVYVNLSD